MKIRKGFVSNSSSSSFCAQGTSVYTYEEDELFGILKSSFEDGWEYMEAISNKLYELFKNTPITILTGEESVYFGLEYGNLDDEETGMEFKERARKIVDKALKKYGGTKKYPLRFINCEIYSG